MTALKDTAGRSTITALKDTAGRSTMTALKDTAGRARVTALVGHHERDPGPQSLRATTMAPIRAAKSSTDTASKATMYWLKMASETASKRCGSSITTRVSE